MEIGSPMASMYLLGNPDHYTGHQFVCFWWKSYVTYLQREDKTTENSMVDIQAADLPTEENEDRVQVGQEEGVYIATTNVDDYKYRPHVYLSVSLYEWIQTSHKRRANKKELENLQVPSPANVTKTGYHHFMEGHPMCVTHVVKCNFDRLKFVVPNIVGGALPRRDSGDREYYCCTMLTLFFPWRDALCIKGPSETWESAFNAFKFTTRQRQLMCNFSLRYECHDARDDFHALLNKKKLQTRVPWNNGNDSGEESDTDFVRLAPTGQIDHGVHGKVYTASLRMMDSISAILSKAGWLDHCSKVVDNGYVRLSPEHIPGSSWAVILKTCSLAIFRHRFANFVPPIDGGSILWGKSNTGPLVRLLTVEYITSRQKKLKHRK
jgi:hypothetical protein